MIKFSKEKVLLLHQIMAEATGGSVGVRDEGLLDSALEGAFAGFGDREFYPTKEEKGARLGYTLISNHAFVDGNKRIGVYIMLSFLEMNGISLQCTDDELVDIGLSVAGGASGCGIQHPDTFPEIRDSAAVAGLLRGPSRSGVHRICHHGLHGRRQPPL